MWLRTLDNHLINLNEVSTIFPVNIKDEVIIYSRDNSSVQSMLVRFSTKEKANEFFTKLTGALNSNVECFDIAHIVATIEG